MGTEPIKFVPLTPCHGGAKLAFTVGKVSFWGCAGSAVDKVPPPRLAQVSLAGSISDTIVEVSDNATDLFKRSMAVANAEDFIPAMGIDWNDGAIPPVPFLFWAALIADLKGKEGNLIVNCFGGHGRTGTALLCLAWTAKLVPKGKDAVLWLREVYCEEAIETLTQINYLKKQGIRTKVKPKVISYNTDNYQHNWSPTAPERCEFCLRSCLKNEIEKSKKLYEGLYLCIDCEEKFAKATFSKSTEATLIANSLRTEPQGSSRKDSQYSGGFARDARYFENY